LCKNRASVGSFFVKTKEREKLIQNGCKTLISELFSELFLNSQKKLYLCIRYQSLQVFSLLRPGCLQQTEMLVAPDTKEDEGI
jgi:hypothetical protein